MYCGTVLFALGFVAVISGTSEISDGAVCTCNKPSFSLSCTLATPSDFVKVRSDYCGKRIKSVELQLLRNSSVSTTLLPDVSVFRFRITGPYLNKLSEKTFKGKEDSLRSVEIVQASFTDIPSVALQRLHHLESISVVGNSVYSIDCSLEKKPLKSMILHENEISLVYSCAFPQNLTSLSLKNNRIETLNGSLRHHNNLEMLFMERNRITSLEGELDGLNNLAILFASWNKITSIGTKLINLPKLLNLDLSHNRISELGDSLSGFHNLISLDLSHNDLESLSAGMFDNLKKLRTMNIFGNSIRSLDDGLFKSLAKLEVLDISNNVISSLDGKLDGMSSLRRLDASFNNIRVIDNPFASLKSLEELFLQYNHIAELGNTLSTLSQLKHLEFTFNDLRELNEDTFVGAKNLEKINLSYNTLRPLNGTVFASLPKLSTLNLSHNPLQRLKALVVPGFMNATVLATEDTVEKGDCRWTKSLLLTHTLSCIPDTEETQMMAVLRDNGIEVVGC